MQLKVVDIVWKTDPKFSKEDNVAHNFISSDRKTIVVIQGVRGGWFNITNPKACGLSALQAIEHFFTPDATNKEPKDLIVGAFTEVQQSLQQLVTANTKPEAGHTDDFFAGPDDAVHMVVATLSDTGSLLIGHVGQCRTYLRRKGALQKVTKDHSIGEQLIEEHGSDLDVSKFSHMLTRIVRSDGSDITRAIDTYELTVGSGDQLVVCTDGIMGVNRQLIQQLAGRENYSLSDVCNAIISLPREDTMKTELNVLAIELGSSQQE